MFLYLFLLTAIPALAQDEGTGCAAVEPPQHTAESYYNRGAICLGQGDYAQAITLYTSAIELDPDYTYAIHSRGVAYERLGNYEKAIADYKRAIRIEDYAFSHYGLGYIYYAQGKYEDSIAEYTRAIERDPTYIDTYRNRGIAYYQLGEYDLAIADYLHVIQLNPAYKAAYVDLGDAHFVQGEYIQAIAAYRLSLTEGDQCADLQTHKRLGNTYYELERYPEALASYQLYMTAPCSLLDFEIVTRMLYINEQLEGTDK